MNKRFKLGDLVLPDTCAPSWPGQLSVEANVPGIIIRKEPAEYPDKWHRLDYTVLWSSGTIEDDIWGEELKHMR